MLHPKPQRPGIATTISSSKTKITHSWSSDTQILLRNYLGVNSRE